MNNEDEDMIDFDAISQFFSDGLVSVAQGVESLSTSVSSMDFSSVTIVASEGINAVADAVMTFADNTAKQISGEGTCIKCLNSSILRTSHRNNV